MENHLCIEGFFDVVIYRNDNGFTVAKFRTNEKTEKVLTITGILGEVFEDSPYRLYGDYCEHPKYGMQFKLESYERILPTDDTSLIRYFSSALFKGIGKKAASKIVAQLGKDAIQIIQEDESVVNQLTGITELQKESLKEGVINGVDNSIVFLTQHGVSAKNVLKIEAIYENRAISIIKSNPYQLIHDIDGIGFKTADKIAMSLGFDEESPERLKAAIVSIVLGLSMKSGNSYESKNLVFQQMKKNFQLKDEQAFERYLQELQFERYLHIENEDIYHISQFDAENGIATFLQGYPYILHQEVKEEELSEEIDCISKEFNIVYDESQVEAIHTFFKEPFSIMTGGPGTGKTTIVRAIIALHKKMYPLSKISLCAPTGRAAKRLGELGGTEATTIHSLLKWDLETNVFSINADSPIESDLLIIDEFSMVDAWLFYNLLMASKNISKILVIGDEDQLPSVGPGFVIKDLIESNNFKMTRLHKIYRQIDGSDVIRLAHDIKEGNLISLKDGSDVKMFSCLNYQVKDQILKIVSNAFEKGYSEFDIQVLAPMYNGVAGIDSLNKALQSLCNPPSDDKKELQLGYRLFRENDKILQLKNQPDNGVYNGDIGKIIEIVYSHEDHLHQSRIIIDFEGIVVEYTSETFNNITHAYCISIHKSQGSEYPIVIMPILSDYAYMLQRRLIYTGITRAKKSLVLLGSFEALEKGIRTNERHQRNTKLKKRLQERQDEVGLF